ncbi:GIY-YIG nuclease family protein [Streptomyces lavendulocolor]|uniref:GIY-YIG nuclease family protein n=1 Tax=Streptomyces lavendulocolor TaxID=67316 RepID=UPI003C2B8533
MVQRNQKPSHVTSRGRLWAGDCGPRASMQKVLKKLDMDDPAMAYAARELQQLVRRANDLDEDTIQQAVDRGRAALAEHARKEAERSRDRIPASIVYYARRANTVKIGTTTNAHARFSTLLPDEVLAWEPGGRTEEQQRHQQFRALRINARGEYFWHRDELVAHIQNVRTLHGAPDPTWPTLARLPQPTSRAHRPDIPTNPGVATLKAGTRKLGIRYNTAQVWVHRGKLRPILEDADGTKLYLLSDLRSLADAGQAPESRGTSVT